MDIWRQEGRNETRLLEEKRLEEVMRAKSSDRKRKKK